MRKRTQMPEMARSDTPDAARIIALVRRPLWLTRAGMVVERATRAFWPLWSWGFVVCAALSFRALDALPAGTAVALLLVALAATLGLLSWGFFRFRWPTLPDAVARLDRSLKGRPLSTLVDRLAIGKGDAGSIQVWRAHLVRMQDQLADSRAVAPDLRISDRDRFGLRYIAATALVVALLFGQNDLSDGFDQMQSGGQAAAALATGPAFEGWIEPPRYTGLPTIYLNGLGDSAPLRVPQGSKVSIRLYGKAGALAVRQTISASNQPGDTAAADQTFVVGRSGSLGITGASAGASWQIEMIPDTAPMITLTGPVGRSPDGKMKLGFEAVDDYGVVGGTATLTLNLFAVDRRYGLALDPEPQPDIVLNIPLPFNGKTTDFRDQIIQDLSRHPWAGLPVTLTLSATDALGQKGLAEPESIILPGRRFFDPLAAAIVEQRRDLLWNRKNARRVAQVLRAVSNLPEDIFDNPTAYLILQTTIRRLEFNLTPGPTPGLSDSVRSDVANLLWRTALLIEDGNLSNAAARLRRAQDRLSEALKNGATNEEIAKLSEDLRQAIQDYMNQLAQNAEKNPNQNQAQNGQTREITSDQIQQMLDRIRELSRQGRNDEAQKLLAQLNRLMANMRTARRQPGQGKGQQSMRNLQDTLRQQQDLSDEAFRKMQEQFNAQRPAQPDAGDLARRQKALGELLDSQRRALPDSASKEGRAARQALRRAEKQMDRARKSLEQGDLPKALDDQADALKSLRQGLNNLGRDLARKQTRSNGQRGDQAGSNDPNANRDPLGRQTGAAGRIGSNRTLLQEDKRLRRSRELLNEIRRRSGEKSRPGYELEYLNRLLDRF